jgi:hypothetical protein
LGRQKGKENEKNSNMMKASRNSSFEFGDLIMEID